MSIEAINKTTQTGIRISDAKNAIKIHLNKYGADLLSDPVCDGEEWIALVAITPSGPLVRMGFKLLQINERNL